MSARILVVEDTPHTLRLMTYLLRAQGHQVSGFRNAEPAIEAAVADPPDLIILDIQLAGGINGYDAVGRLRAHQRLATVPAIAVTAFAMVGDREQALAAGFNEYLTKPIDPYTFAERVDEQLPPALRGQAPTVAAPSRDTAIKHPVVGSAGPAIIVVDDLPTNAELLRSILEPHGYRVVVVHSVDAALAAVRRRRPALILSDIHLGHESGFELYRQMIEDPKLAAIPFAFTTATAASMDDLPAGVSVIRRPVEPAELLVEVTRLTEIEVRS